MKSGITTTQFLIFTIVLLFMGCRQQSQNNVENLTRIINTSLDKAVQQYKEMDQAVPEGLFPRTTVSATNDSLVTSGSGWWVSGFFPGSLWYLYEYSGDPELRQSAIDRTWSVEQEKLNAGTHDVGFMIYCSFGNAFRLTGDSSYAEVMMTAAETLTKRFDPDVGAIRSWGDRTNQEDPYLVIIDNMMNLELLFWATEFSGDSTYAQIAIAHADTTLANHFREDGSSFHVVEYDPQAGEVLRKRTAQGCSAESAWARGQSWGLYGYTMAYRETGLNRYLEQADKIAQFLLDHPRLPDDYIPYWDYDAPDIPDTYRDASAAAIMASALLELSRYVEQEKSDFYLNSAKTIIGNLSRDPYRAGLGENASFLLKHSVGSLPGSSEVDVPLSYADYYYLEAMMRCKAILNF